MVFTPNFQTSYWRTVWTNPGDIPKKFALTSEELDTVEGCENDEGQRRFLEQIVIDKDLPVSMRTIQVMTEVCGICLHNCVFCVSGGSEILREMRSHQTRPSSPLFSVWLLCPQDGPPLPLGEQLCRLQQLQVLCPLPPLRSPLLSVRGSLLPQVFPQVLDAHHGIGG